MRSGVEVVYQATFFDGAWRGHADFLLRSTARRGGPGPTTWPNQARPPVKVPALLQMATYAERLADSPGRRSRVVVVVTGDRSGRTGSPTAPLRQAGRPGRSEFLGDRRWPPARPGPALRAVPVASTAVPGAMARPRTTCPGRRHAPRPRAGAARGRDHDRCGLSARRPAGCRGRSATQRVSGWRAGPAAGRTNARPAQRARPARAEPVRGLALLPEPVAGRRLLRHRGRPVPRDGRAGVPLRRRRRGRFTAYWAHDPARRRPPSRPWSITCSSGGRPTPGCTSTTTRRTRRRAQAALRRHTTREAELDRLLRGEAIVDLYAVVRQGMQDRQGVVLDQEAGGLLLGPRACARRVADALSAASSRTSDGSLAGDGRRPGDPRRHPAYNEDDFRSTQALREWLEARRAELRPRGRSSAPQVPEPEKGTGDEERAESELGRATRRPAGHGTAPPDSSARHAARSGPRGGTSSATTSSRRPNSSRTPPPSAASVCRRSGARSRSPLSGATPARRRMKGLARRIRARVDTHALACKVVASTPPRGGSTFDPQAGRTAAAPRTRGPGPINATSCARPSPHRRAGPHRWGEPCDPTPRAGRAPASRPHPADRASRPKTPSSGSAPPSTGRCSPSRARPGQARRITVGHRPRLLDRACGSGSPPSPTPSCATCSTRSHDRPGKRTGARPSRGTRQHPTPSPGNQRQQTDRRSTRLRQRTL